jgi:hypothetical protein
MRKEAIDMTSIKLKAEDLRAIRTVDPRAYRGSSCTSDLA